MIPKHISFSLYKYFESIKNRPQNGQILSFFHFSSLKNGKSMTFLNEDCERTENFFKHSNKKKKLDILLNGVNIENEEFLKTNTNKSSAKFYSKF